MRITKLSVLLGATLGLMGLAAAPTLADAPACLKDSSETCYSGPVNLTSLTFDASDVDRFYPDGTNVVMFDKSPNNHNGYCTAASGTATTGPFATLPQPFSLDTLRSSGGGPTGKCKLNMIGVNQMDVTIALPQTGGTWLDTSSPPVRGRDGALKFDGSLTVTFNWFNNATPLLGAGGVPARCVYRSALPPEGDVYNAGGGVTPETRHGDVIVLNRVSMARTNASNYAACPNAKDVYLEVRPRTPTGGQIHVG